MAQKFTWSKQVVPWASASLEAVTIPVIPSGFMSQVIPRGLASRSGLRVGDRILEVNGTDLRHATHQEAVNALLANGQELTLLVRRDPPPPGMQVSARDPLLLACR
ncbi:hypothetical protein IHE44_0001347 [Lamprotornis superbus]|uniref:PDZ domain-containing protein n=1 Tax=Lamprotornis superbus TaxID=245042 RepID=A0A835NDQ3_9PASS|nr:hypothetical protein IHE44_0001347 [Lamprotornis superbus]